jgi:hypothetical protein
MPCSKSCLLHVEFAEALKRSGENGVIRTWDFLG